MKRYFFKGNSAFGSLLAAVFLIGLFPAHYLYALQPEEILVLANGRTSGSVKLARYYMERRAIPKDNLIELRTTNDETCSREEYEKNIYRPVKSFLEKRDPGQGVRCLVTLFGVPLRVLPEELTESEKAEAKSEEKALTDARAELKKMEEEGGKKEEIEALRQKMDRMQKRIGQIRKESQLAALDSELSLVLAGKYRLENWLPNPYFAKWKGENDGLVKPRIFMVSRLDGPDEKVVRRIIDDSIETEKTGLAGIGYFDARYPAVKEPGSGYAKYDLSIHRAAEIVKKNGFKDTVLETSERLFQPGECPDAALYCGWYSLSKYIDAFSWRNGAVGYHIASGECATLKRRDSGQWCIQMLEKGVAATLGPVAEPYVYAFPPPELFFHLLLQEKLPLGETYFFSSPFLSWRMVLVGDPLYRPRMK